MKLLRSKKLLVLAEQALISGANFLLYLFAARLLPKPEWGVASFALAALLVLQGAQRAFVTIPLISFATQPDRAAPECRPGLWANLQLAVTMASVLLFALAWAVSAAVAPQWIAQSLLLATLLVGPVFYMEYSRRIVIQQQNLARLLLMAVGYALVVLLGMALMFLFPSFWLMTGMLCAASLVAVALALASAGALREYFWPMTWLRPSDEVLRFGYWSMGASLSYSLYNFAIQAILGLLGGAAAIATYAATRNLTQPVNTLLQAMDSIDKPRAARSFASNGAPGLYRSMGKSVSQLLLLGGPYLLIVALFGQNLLGLLYGDKYLDAHGALLAWCGILVLMMFAQISETGLYIAKIPDQLLYSRMFASVVALAAAVPLINLFGVVGALLGIAIGWFLAFAGGFTLLRRYLGRQA